MNRKAIVIIALQAFMIVVLFWVLVFYGKDEYEAYLREEQEEEISAESIVATDDDGATVVNLSPKAQQHSGVATSALQAATRQATLDTLGSVVDISPLLELRGRYLAALAEADAARAALAASAQEYRRLAELNRDDKNVSDRAVATAQAAQQGDQARLGAAESAAASLRASLRQQWGGTLADWAARRDPPAALQRLIARQEALVQIILPAAAGAAPPATLSLAAATGEGAAMPATLVSAAPFADSTLPGRTYYYRAPAEQLRAGMRVAATLPGRAAQAAGVAVPHTAVVWYGGQAWVYRKQQAGTFVRLPVSTELETGQGWFNRGDLKPGDELVTRGAQLLLSEEFKYQIKNENED